MPKGLKHAVSALLIALALYSLLGFLIFASTQPMLGYMLKFFVDGLNNPNAGLFSEVPWLLEHAPGWPACRCYRPCRC